MLPSPLCWTLFQSPKHGSAPACSLLFVAIEFLTKNVGSLEVKYSPPPCIRISKSLKCDTTSNLSSQRRTRNIARRKRTNKILISVSLVFFISWAPLNILSLILDYQSPLSQVRLFSQRNLNYSLSSKNLLLCCAAHHPPPISSADSVNNDDITTL